VPLYDYHCKKCEKIFEIMVKLDKSDKEIECPYCKKKLTKLMSPVSFRMNP
jgi:putative FmdB family regulatory protein